MHVLWTPSWYPTPEFPFNGTFFKDQVAILRGAGHEVGVCALSAKSFWQWRPSKTVVNGADRLVANSFPMIPKGIIRGDRAIIEAYARHFGQTYVKRWGTPDIIHAHSVFPGILVARHLASVWNIPYGLTEHRPSTLEASETTARFAQIYQAVRSADFRLSVSQEFSKELRRKYDVDFGVVSLPVPDAFFEMPLVSNESEIVRFVHISHLDDNKRVEQTIEAFGKTHAEFPNTSLDIIGGTPDRIMELAEFARGRRLIDAVHFLGQVDRETLPTVLAGYDTLVLASSKEAGGTVFAESQSLGIPIIATATFGGLHMTRPNTGIVVPVDDFDALAEAMKMVASNPGIWEPTVIREIARDRFSSATFVKKHEDIYRSAIARFSDE
ncbi:glycosyltransferase [Actinomyces sp. HMSC065F11]|uniref:glycosyltransferase n=1 Tax=Actinomyces sp. HMSC065F11 TaxID=1739395 RepID=UPI0008A46D57|nr:glycosyltransferase [Actinomyces sp. HMSC065F11]OFR31182.1 hypothetical protein HMPREF2891_03825 [Actinomyces sp. HMSC065F11]